MSEATLSYDTPAPLPDQEAMVEKLDLIGLMLARERSDAISGRQDSGIEDEWLEDEEYYEGIDDANRQEMKAWRGKPLGQQTPMDDNEAEDRGSNVFLNITRPYCDATASRMGDMLLPTDDRAFSVKPTPKPEFIEIKAGRLTKEMERAIEAEHPNDPDGVLSEVENIKAQLKAEADLASEVAKKVEQQIWDWHVECGYHAHNRRVIEDASKVGSGVLKGPVPQEKTKRVYLDGQLREVTEVKPVSMRIDYRNFFPDPACGEDIHDGNFTFERDDITRKKLVELKGGPGYISEQIDRCIAEGPLQASKEFSEEQERPGLKSSSDARRSMFEIWYYHGSLRREELQLLDIFAGRKFREYPDEYVFVQVIMVNNRVLKAALSQLPTGEFPYDVLVWQRRVGLPWGIGVARQIRPAQRILVGAVRHMMDNSGIAGGPMLFVNDLLIQPADGVNEVRPWKIWVAGPEYEPGMDAGEALQYLAAPTMQQELQAIIELALKFAEDITGLPLIMQGQTNSRTPDTLGGMQLQSNNSSTVLRRVARNHDDMITEPHILRYYDHILEYSKDESMKGEFVIDALGSSSLFERDLQNEATLALGQYVANPIYKKDPAKWMDELLKANKLDSKRFDYDDEDWQKLAEQMSQPPADPRLEVAQANNELKERLAQVEIAERDKDRLEQEKDRALKMGLAEMEREFDIYLKEMGEEGASSRGAEDAKERMAETMVKLRAQLYLAGQDGAGGELVTPPVEPPGRAEVGRSYEQ